MDAQAVPKTGVGQVPWQSSQTQPNKFLFTASALEGLSHRIGGIRPHCNGPHNAANNRLQHALPTNLRYGLVKMQLKIVKAWIK